MRKNYSVVFLSVLSAVILSGCGNTAENTLPDDELPSMTSVSPYSESTSDFSESSAEYTSGSSDTKASPAPSETISSVIAASSESEEVTDPPETDETSAEMTTLTTRYLDPLKTESTTVHTTVPPVTTVRTSSPAVTAPPVTVTQAPVTTTAPPQKQYDRKMTFAEYFSDSLFIGDSICSGLKIYGGLLNVENCAARINVSTWGINKYTFQYKSNSTAELDALSIVKLYQPKKIFIWMGMNDLYVVSADKYASNLCDLAESYIEASPGCKVYAVSISPMSSTHKWNVELDGNNRINEYNQAVKDKCDEVDYLEYINIHDCLTDSSGYLASENNGGDGIHLSSGAYTKVLTEIFNYMENEKAEEAAAETSSVTEETTTAPVTMTAAPEGSSGATETAVTPPETRPDTTVSSSETATE